MFLEAKEAGGMSVRVNSVSVHRNLNFSLLTSELLKRLSGTEASVTVGPVDSTSGAWP